MASSPELQLRYLPCYEDPRRTPGFSPDCYPAERNSEDTAPKGVEEVKARFRAVYARRNACIAALSGLTADDPRREELSDYTHHLTEAIDHLEDVCAPTGIVAEPVMDDSMFTSELIFTHAPLVRAGVEPGTSSFSLYIPIPLDDTSGKEAAGAS